MGVLKAALVFLRAFLLRRAAAAFKNMALRQQLAVCKQSSKRPKLRLDISLPGRFVATGLGVTVEQPESRGILCFLVAILSLATQFDMCAVGWYNRRMEFLGRTTPHVVLPWFSPDARRFF